MFQPLQQSRVIVLAGILALVGQAKADDDGDRIRNLENQQEQLSEELEKLQRQLEAKTSERVDEVERRQGILTDEIRRLREALVLPETKELKSQYGMGPAASKVYGVERGFSIGGYGEANFKSVVSDKGDDEDVFDFLRFVLYFGYKYNDWIIFNSEIEFEHASSSSTVTSGDGSVSVEFATLDFLFHPMANGRIGLVLVPFGFLNEIHEPPFFHGNDRPEVESQIIPSTWRTNGFGLFGELAPGLEYKAYGITSLNAKGFGSGNIRSARQKGNRELGEDFSFVGRLDYSLLPGSLIGASAFVGDQGQGQNFGGVDADVFMQMYEGHFQLHHRGFEFRALGVVADIDDAAALSADPDIDETVADRMAGYYVEAAYDVLPWFVPETTQYLAPWLRYSSFDTQDSVPGGFERDATGDREVIEAGLSYKPIPQVILKADYRNFDSAGGDLPDEVRLGFGYVF